MLKVKKIFSGIFFLSLMGIVPAYAQEIHSTVNVDILPDQLTTAQKVLESYIDEVKKDKNVLSAELLQQINTPNHFIIYETTSDRKIYDQHEEAGYVKQFRAKIYPYLGSPWDERLAYLVK